MTYNVLDLDSMVPVVLTTNHARSSYGIPVLVCGGVAIGPHDRPILVAPLGRTRGGMCVDNPAPPAKPDIIAACKAWNDRVMLAATDAHPESPYMAVLQPQFDRLEKAMGSAAHDFRADSPYGPGLDLGTNS
jgi:hypothetical protein